MVEKLLQFKVTEEFNKRIEDFLEKVNDSGEYPYKYRKSQMVVEAIEAFMNNGIPPRK